MKSIALIAFTQKGCNLAREIARGLSAYARYEAAQLSVSGPARFAEEAGVEADIEAHGVGSIERRLDSSIDVVLLGPQIGYQKAQVKKVTDKLGIPMEVIPMTDYGMVNGKNVFALAQKLAAGK